MPPDSMSNKPRQRFGDTAVRLGYVSSEQVTAALSEQARRREANGGRTGPIGSLLQEKGLLTPTQITAVLGHLASSDLPLTEDGIRLAARLKVLHAGQSNVIGLAGSVGEDAAAAAAEIAVALAVIEQGRVLLVDADLHEATLHERFGHPRSPGLVEQALQGQSVGLPTALSSLDVVPAGTLNESAVAALMSPQAARLVAAWRERYRYIVVNLGDVLHRPEAAVSASRCDGVVAVLRAGLSEKPELRAMQQMLAGLKVGLSGVVLAQPGKPARKRA